MNNNISTSSFTEISYNFLKEKTKQWISADYERASRFADVHKISLAIAIAYLCGFDDNYSQNKGKRQ
jgi:hypothetical protein